MTVGLTVSLAGEGRLPLGREVWDDTRIVLPDGAPAGFVNAVTGAAVDGPGGLYAAELFASFPAALLLSRPGPDEPDSH
jgi:(1->4)-alpha-D-glucan 1-alpha-D-glucosylmutase